MAKTLIQSFEVQYISGDKPILSICNNMVNHDIYVCVKPQKPKRKITDLCVIHHGQFVMLERLGLQPDELMFRLELN